MKLYESMKEVCCFLYDCRVIFVILNVMKYGFELSSILYASETTECIENSLMNHENILICEVAYCFHNYLSVSLLNTEKLLSSAIVASIFSLMSSSWERE